MLKFLLKYVIYIILDYKIYYMYLCIIYSRDFVIKGAIAHVRVTFVRECKVSMQIMASLVESI